MQKKKAEKRKRSFSSFQVRVTEDEYSQIVERAEATGLTPSSLMRELGLKHRPKTIIDAKWMLELIRLRGDQGRVGGLLKLWLSDDAKAAGFDRHKILGLVQELETLKKDIGSAVRKLEEKTKKHRPAN